MSVSDPKYNYTTCLLESSFSLRYCTLLKGWNKLKWLGWNSYGLVLHIEQSNWKMHNTSPFEV